MKINEKQIKQDVYFTWDSKEKIPKEILEDMIAAYLSSDEIKRIDMYKKYYSGENADLTKRYRDKAWRGKTPNNYVPTAYYSTIIDTMAGYMFSNVQYTPENPTDETYSELLNDILYNNNVDIKDMKTGVNSLAYNKAIELVYTVGDGISSPQIKYTSLDPKNVLLIYNDSIEPEIICGVRITISKNKDYDYQIDVIYKDEWQYYYMKSGALIEKEDSRQLFFTECPIIVYKSEIMNDNSPFHTIIPYIDALDYLITGNSNEIERLVDAILVIGHVLEKEDLDHMDEIKALMDMKQEDRAEYLTKDMSPQFREYVSKLLIQEIHKHSHVIDWYSPDTGLGGDVSAKALRTRLFDMDMFSRRIEKVFKEGSEKRIRLINQLLSIQGQQVGNIDIIYNRTKPDDFEDKAVVLNNISFLSDYTKIEMLGLDPEKEMERKEEELSTMQVDNALFQPQEEVENDVE